MSKDRLKSISRLLAVQSDLHQLAERKLALVVQREAALERERAELLDALNDDQIFYGSFIYPMAKRLRAIDDAKERTTREKEKESREVTRHATRKKRIERLKASIAAEWERNEDRRQLLELIERSAGQGKTSLG